MQSLLDIAAFALEHFFEEFICFFLKKNINYYLKYILNINY